MKTKRWAAVLAVIGCIATFAENSWSVVTNGSEVIVTVDSDFYRLYDVYGPEITNIVKRGKGTLQYTPTTQSSHGAIDIENGQLRLYSTLGLGTGAIFIGPDSDGLLIDMNKSGQDFIIPNKVVFGRQGVYAAAFNSELFGIRLQSVGTPSGSDTHSIGLGRAGSDYSRAVLSLTGEDSEAISQIRLRGNTDLVLDGGTLKARADAVSPFIYDTVPSAGIPKTCTVSAAGVTIDVAAGGLVELGLHVGFAGYTNTLETVSPANCDFESGESGWTYSTGTNTQSKVGVKTNGDATWASSVYDAHGGSRFMGLRWGHSIKSSPVAIATSSTDWFVGIDVACRPGASYYGHTVPIEVIVDEGTDAAQSATIPPRPENHADFRRFLAGPFTLAAGDHTVTIRTYYGTVAQSYKELFFDWIKFERLELNLDRPRTGALVKTGEGTLRGGMEFATNATLTVVEGAIDLEDASSSALWLSVSGGEANLRSMTLTDSSNVQVLSGATAGLYATALTNASTVSVAAGGTLVLADDYGENCMVNGSFELDGVKTNAVPLNPTGWTMSKIENTEWNTNGSGLQGNGGNVSPEPGGPFTTNGAVTAYLRDHSMLSQTVEGVPAGRYRLSFEVASRIYGASHRMSLSVMVDGFERLSLGPRNAAYGFEPQSVFIDLTAGDHVLAFVTGGIDAETGKGGTMLFVDSVRLERLLPIADITDGEISLSAGGLIQLDNMEPVAVKSLFVNGVRINGGRRTVGAAGVTVRGTGLLKAGEPISFMVILR